jgi:acyl-coenzyme A synthetase/AMP-(fatty) acid ligase
MRGHIHWSRRVIDLVEMIFFHADANPDKPAIIISEATLTYAMLRKGILSVERQLRSYGLKAGDRVAVSIVNAIGHMTLICALHRAGITSVSVDPPQIEFLDDMVIDAVLTNAPVSGTPIRMIPVDESWFNGELPAAIERYSQPREGDQICRLIFSSGTTGRPKIIALTFEAVQERLISYSIRMSTPSWDRLVCMPGLSTNYGYCFAITTLWLGRTICFAYDATARQLILAHQAEMLVASTHQITDIVKGQEEGFLRLETLRSIHIGGAVAYAPLNARIRLMVCNLLYCGYGSTEGGTVAYAPAESVYGMDRAVGIVAPWIEIQVFDDDKNVVDYGKPGEIRLRALGQGYRYTKTSPTEYQVDQTEWFYPGDQGMVFRNGMLAVTGRINEIINRGGTKVSPETIEEALKKHPKVEDVAVVGMLDEIGIEQIWVAVRSRGGEEIDIGNMFDFCREATPMHIPDRIFQVKDIPRNRLGKISRETLKDELKTQEKNMALTVR